MAEHRRPRAQAVPDDLWTIAALGALAYVGETLGHELIGHGSACILSGGRITALAPLWMRCSVQTIPMVAAGPIFNFIAAGLFAAAARWRRRSDTRSYFLWLSCSFNLLVACGYLAVGGATAWGDWGFVFAAVKPAWAWRVTLIVLGLAGYVLGLRGLGNLYAVVAGNGGFSPGVLRRRTLVPGAAAALVACAAEIAGGRIAAGSIALSLGCTLFVGWTLGLVEKSKVGGAASELAIPRSAGWLWAALVGSAAFIGFVGPAAKFG
jgi:hypothetical protein